MKTGVGIWVAEKPQLTHKDHIKREKCANLSYRDVGDFVTATNRSLS